MRTRSAKRIYEKKLRGYQMRNILYLPDELLLPILEYSIEDIRDYNTIESVCENLSTLVKDHTLYKRIKISDEETPKSKVSILKTYRKYVKTLRICNVHLNRLNSVLKEVKNLKNLTSIKFKNVVIAQSSIKFVKDIVKNCKEINKFSISKTHIRHPSEWVDLLTLLSTRKIQKFSFHNDMFYLPRWDMTTFLRKNRDSLISLKVPATCGLPIKSIGRCSKLETLYLDPGLWPHHRYSLQHLHRLENLTNICIDTDNFLLRDIPPFFSRPCCAKLQKIRVSSGSDYNGSVLIRSIIRNCPNVEKLNLEIGMIGRRSLLTYEIVLDILNSCRRLKSLTVLLMSIWDIMKLDKIMNERNYPQLESFFTAFRLPPIHQKFLREKGPTHNPFFRNIPANFRSICWIHTTRVWGINKNFQNLEAKHHGIWKEASVSYEKKT